MEEAIYGDCHDLISNFVQNENPSFKTFCLEWKKLCFQHIFTPQTTYIEIQQTTVTAFHYGKRVMCNRNATADNSDYFNQFDVNNEDSKILVRIGGLYLLYAIYFKQPLELYTKIEASLETFRQMKEFIQVTLPERSKINNINYDEARFIFWKLYKYNAFRFTALDFCVGLEGLVDYDHLDRTATNMASRGGGPISNIGQSIQKLSSFVEIKQTTPALVTLEDSYNKMKESLTKMHDLDEQLLPPTNIFQSIRDGFQRIEKVLNNSNDTEDNQNGNKNQRPTSSKRSLKEKAFASSKNMNTTEANKNESDDDTDEMEEEKPKKYPKRMSSRTIFAEKLPKDIEKDLQLNDYNAEESEMELVAASGRNESTSADEENNPSPNENNDNDLNIDQVTRACEELLNNL